MRIATQPTDLAALRAERVQGADLQRCARFSPARRAFLVLLLTAPVRVEPARGFELVLVDSLTVPIERVDAVFEALGGFGS